MKVGDVITLTAAMVTNPLSDSYKVVIRRNVDGLVRKCQVDQPFWDDATVSGQDSAFYWTDGNGACDCNMATVFLEAGGDDSDHAYDCGETAFTLVGFELPNGELIKP